MRLAAAELNQGAGKARGSGGRPGGTPDPKAIAGLVVSPRWGRRSIPGALNSRYLPHGAPHFAAFGVAIPRIMRGCS
jgi:hypothetical protein